jgi:RNA polymerase sigma-70 factor (ECF subfamily)
MQDSNSLLINRSIQGDEKAMMQLYDLYCGAMYNVACRYLSEEDAKDAMQEAFLKAFSKLEQFEPMVSFGAWLKKIVINQCIDELKKRRIEFKEANIEQLEVIEEEDWMFDTNITKDMIIAAIERINPKHQTVLKLYLMEGFDHKEISKILVIPIKTSRTHLRRGRLDLQDLLKKYKNEKRY